LCGVLGRPEGALLLRGAGACCVLAVLLLDSSMGLQDAAKSP
jgi:hypothetical protein